MSNDVTRILVATDFSDCSMEAVRLAWKSAQAFGATLDLIHIWSYAPVYTRAMVSSGPPEDAVKRIEQQARERMATFQVQIDAEGITINAVLVRSGTPAEGVLHETEAGRYDLLVAGTHGRKGVSRLFIGSVAEKLVRSASCPVLTVRSA
ncbi:MAG: nucleotide-binding universal stress UspA family protein [Myxococcota bacterium]|jgi:nucleotide-binding universal stress UspA family protein